MKVRLGITLGIIILCIVLTLCYQIAQKLFIMPRIPPPQGDGTFSNISRRYGPFAAPGYKITMPEFEMSDKVAAEYQIVNMPSIGEDCYLFFAIRNPEKDPFAGLRGLTDASVAIELVEKSGEPIIAMSGKLHEFRIMVSSNNYMSLYQLGKSSFVPKEGGDYVIRLKFDGDPHMRGYQGFLYLQSRVRK
jgi:hypothetical protein